MAGKTVVPVDDMIAKVRAAVGARQRDETFILARTDAIEPEGVDSAIKRAEVYLEAGADGAYVRDHGASMSSNRSDALSEVQIGRRACWSAAA